MSFAGIRQAVLGTPHQILWHVLQSRFRMRHSPTWFDQRLLTHVKSYTPSYPSWQHLPIPFLVVMCLEGLVRQVSAPHPDYVWLLVYALFVPSILLGSVQLVKALSEFLKFLQHARAAYDQAIQETLLTLTAHEVLVYKADCLPDRHA